MPPADPDAESLLREWIEKADANLETAERPARDVAESARQRENVAFHCQQAVEKYLEALLTRRQIEFPKTHDIKALRMLVHAVDRQAADSLSGAHWLTPFGVQIRYPGDTAEMLPEEELRAVETARQARAAVIEALQRADG